MKDYLGKMKNHMDILAARGHPIQKEDQILYVFGGVGIEYDPVVVHIISRTDSLYSHQPSISLLAHEGCIEAYNVNGTNTSHVANVSTLSPRKKSEHFQSHPFEDPINEAEDVAKYERRKKKLAA